MKLVFNKNEEQEISVLFKIGANTTEFSYIHMIKKLIDVKSMEEPEFEGDFSDAEKESVRSMISHINREVTEFYSEEEE